MKKRITEFTLDSIGEFLAQYAEKSDRVYWLSSPDFEKITYISPAYEKIWGRKIDELYTNPSSWVDALVLEAGEQYNPIAQMAEKIAIDGSEARLEETYRIWRPDGEIRWIMDHGFPVYDKHGNCCGVTGVATDITANKQVEAALNAAKVRAESANRAKTDFLAKITHELRTPLNGILGNVDLLIDSNNLTEKQHVRLNSIASSGEHLFSLINELLDCSILESGKNDLTKAEFSLNDMLQDIYNQYSAISQKKNIPLYIDCDEKCPPVIGDEKRLKQIIINLVGNAIKFTQKGHIRIILKILTHDQMQLDLQITVQDTGVGIPEDKQEYIFEKFNQLDDGLGGSAQGFGLGLAICREIIEQMQGNIKIQSKLNKGTNFIVNLSLPAANPQSQKTGLIQDLSYKILVVEDHPINQMVVVAMLEKMNCSVATAADGYAALELFEPNKFDLILTDISLPDMDGNQLVQLIRKQDKAIPIIAITAHTNAEVKRAAYDAGVNDVMNKPISQKTLQEKLLRWHQASSTF